MDLNVLVGAGARVPEHVGVDVHAARLFAITPEKKLEFKELVLNFEP